MKILKKTTYIKFLILIVIPFISFSQNIEQKDSSNYKLINAAKEIMAATDTCT